ncbi:MAG: VOC family protein [Solirubrobacteraceae bacterium]
MVKLSTVQLWVHDQEEALAFYTRKLGMEVRSDVTLPEMGGFRWLTVGPPSQPDIATLPGALRGAERAGRRVRRDAGGAPVRHRLLVPRPVGQPHPAHAGLSGSRQAASRADARLAAARTRRA